eukprot:TRINITY_DN13155_c0_g1_i1.p1 TRINITY_DN13155_c0_g1~~TRINITY_DN13155_c0_g1_i1.p1  ORF type:complete len:131 (+),score=6.85 TRINITY_DN13155_c0_g1_i1:172-564(+)
MSYLWSLWLNIFLKAGIAQLVERAVLICWYPALFNQVFLHSLYHLSSTQASSWVRVLTGLLAAAKDVELAGDTEPCLPSLVRCRQSVRACSTTSTQPGHSHLPPTSHPTLRTRNAVGHLLRRRRPGIARA